MAAMPDRVRAFSHEPENHSGRAKVPISDSKSVPMVGLNDGVRSGVGRGGGGRTGLNMFEDLRHALSGRASPADRIEPKGPKGAG